MARKLGRATATSIYPLDNIYYKEEEKGEGGEEGREGGRQ